MSPGHDRKRGSAGAIWPVSRRDILAAAGHDARVRKAASLAIDCKGTNEALTLGYSAVTGNAIVPKGYDFYWQPPAPVYDPDKAKQLLAEAGFRTVSTPAITSVTPPTPISAKAWSTTCWRPASAASCGPSSARPSSRNTARRSTRTSSRRAQAPSATRIEAHLVKGGVFSYGSYPDIDELYQQQAHELDRAKREGMLFKIQQLMVERTIFAPIWQLAFINGVGPRVGESGFAGISLFPYTSPYEDITPRSA